MGILSVFMGNKKERAFGETGPEDEIILAMLEEADGATVEEIKAYLHKKEKEISDDALKALLEKLVQKGRIYWDEKLKGYCFQKEAEKDG